MFKRIAFVFVLVFLQTVIFSQGRNKPMQELGIAGGTSYYLGDLNPEKHFGTDLRLGGGMIYRINFDTRWTLKASLLYGSVEAYDSNSDDPWQQNRNLSFRNDIMEGSLQAEINWFDFELGNPKMNIATPYFFAGLAYFKMSPQGEFNGVWYELQPLGTEGQGSSAGEDFYALNSISMPFGVGVKANLYGIMGIGIEWGMRKTWTDYFDDVSGAYVDNSIILVENGSLASVLADRSIQPTGPNSSNTGMQRGDPGRKDWYNFAHVVLSFRITKPQGACWTNDRFRS